MVFVVQSGVATIINLPRFWYQRVLNGIRQFEIVTDGVASTLRAELAVGKVVKIYRDGTLEFQGKIKMANKFQGGGVIIGGLGQEKDLVDTKCPIDSGKTTKTWTSTNDDDIFTALVNEVSGWTPDVSGSTATSLDSFRVSKSMSVWNGIKSLLKHTGKDIEIIDSSKTIKFLDAKGSSDVYTFNEGINCGDISFTEEEPTASKVEVYGKGDGKNQITGSSGSGVPVLEVVDRNIITTTEASNRAAKELAVIQNNLKTYNLMSIKPNISVEVGDSVILNADSVGLHNASIDVVKITRGVNNNSEELSLEVTNPELRIATRNAEEDRANSEMRSITGDSSMQGSGNTLTFGKLGNAKSNVPIIVQFYLSPNHIQDEAGNIRVDTMTLDYDVDPYRKDVGDASFDGTDPQVQNSSANTQPDVAGTSGSTTPSNSAGVSVWHSLTVDARFNKALAYSRATLVGSPSYYTTRVAILVMNITGGSVLATPKVDLPSGTIITYATNYSIGNNVVVSWENGESSSSNVTGWFDFWDDNYNASYVCGTAMNVYQHSHSSHTHGDGSYAAANHLHTDGSYDVNASDINNISIGDDISDAGSINATQVSIYLDFWNTGTSTWDNKHSVLNTGKTLDTDVDITNSGTYPDAVGFWRVRIITDNATPDYLQALVKLKHSLDN